MCSARRSVLMPCIVAGGGTVIFIPVPRVCFV
jgi:hypothetical protein